MRHIRFLPRFRDAPVAAVVVPGLLLASGLVAACMAGPTAPADSPAEGTGALPDSSQGGRGALHEHVPRDPTAPPDSQLWIEIRNVTMHLDDRATIRVRELRGEVISSSRGEPAVLDDSESFSIRVSGGTVALTGDDLTKLLNEFVFAYKGSPLRNLRARPEGGQLTLNGIMHKGVDLRFEITSAMSLTPEGLIRLNPTRVRILGVNGLKLMRALGLRLENLLDLSGSRGASVKGNDIFLDATRILPPPAITGTLREVGVQGSDLAIVFAVTPMDSVFGSYVRPDPAYPNFVYFRGSTLRFGKLLMLDTDLQIVDGDPSDPFDLNLKEYARQLVAGTSRTLPNMGLRVVMPDYASVGKSPE